MRRIVRGAAACGAVALAATALAVGTAAPSAALGTALPFTNITKVVSDGHGHVLVAGGPGSTTLWVGADDGTALTTRDDLAGASDIHRSADGTQLYISLYDSAEIVTVDAASLEVVSRVAVPGTCPDSFARIGDAFWFGSYCGGSAFGVVGTVPVAGGDVTTVLDQQYAPYLVAMGGSPEGLAVAQRGYGAPIVRYAVQGTGLTPVATAEPLSDVLEMAMDPDGAHLDVVSTSAQGLVRLGAADLVRDTDLPTWSKPLTLATTTALGGVVAVGSWGDSAAVNTIRGGAYALLHQFLTDRLVAYGSALSPDGHRLYAVTTPNYPPGGLTLRVVDHAARLVPAVTAAVSRTSVPRTGTVAVTGRLTAAGHPVPGRNVVISRVDVGGTHRIAIRTTSASGTWSVVDRPSYAGTARYVASFAGDAGLDLAAAAGRASVLVVGLSTSMTFTATPSPVYGSNAILTVHLGRTYTGRTVSLWERRYGNPIEQRIGVYRVNASGDVVVARKATTQTTFIAAFGGDQLYMPKRLFRTVGVRARISETLSGWWATVGTYRLYHATNDPVLIAGLVPHPGCLVFQSQVLSSGRWTTGPSSPCFAVDGSGRVGAALTGTHTVGATWRMRAVFRASGGIVTTAGPWLLLQITK